MEEADLALIRGDTSALRATGQLPQSLLYATSARLGGSGLDLVAAQATSVSHQAGFLRRAISFANRQEVVPEDCIKSLRWHPVRLLGSFISRDHYYGAKKHAVDRVARRELENGGYDSFHGWSGEALRTLRMARDHGLPSLLDIPTWHRNKGKIKPLVTKSERERAAEGYPRKWLNDLLISRQRVLEEYELATVLLVQSELAADSFLVQGVPAEKLINLGRGVDVERFRMGEPPSDIFRALFVGALIQRKGVHHLLAVWEKLRLPQAELVLVGQVHDEIKPSLERVAGDPSIKVVGFTSRVQEYYRNSSVFVLPSRLEGSAKVILEAGACGLPLIATRESSDFVQDGVNGYAIPPDDPDALAETLRKAYENRAMLPEMGRAARERIEKEFTWDHFYARLLKSYRLAVARNERLKQERNSA